MNRDCFKSFPVFQTDRLNIRAFREDDFCEYTEWHNGDILYYMMGIHYVEKDDIECFRRLFFKNVPRMFQTKESIVWCVAEKNSDKCIGKIELFRFDMNSNSAEIGYCLSKSERGKGYITEAVKKIIDWAFNILDLNRIYSHVLDENTNSANVLLRCGFQLEGVLRENITTKYTKNGEVIKNSKVKNYKDERIYGLIKSKYNLTKST
ncbi:hypothetical protein SDC9_137940 [bioreactor metagenome]|uniref:N-acetyltransferase domain-containing protein n=1 Tax=bioreactor metagenome TaxID=1076179 RepID=A0A645DNZ0_9ZZZZ